MMSAVHRLSVARAGLAHVVAVAALVAAAVALVVATGAVAVGAAPSGPAPPTVRTVIGAGLLEDPGGLALDAAGDLFVADTGQCRVLVVPARSGTLDGRPVRAGRATTLVGGGCTGHAALGHPSAVAVDGHGDVFVAEAVDQRVVAVRAGSRTVVPVAGTGTAGYNGNGLAATSSQLDQPTGVALDAAGDLFIADTANCRVRVLPAAATTLFGQATTAGHLFTVAGTGVCGSAGQGGPLAGAELWNPVAVAVDGAGDLLVADNGDQSVLLAPARTGSFYGVAIDAGDIGVVAGGTGGYQPYLQDGVPAVGVAAELNDLRGIAVGPTDALFVTDGLMQVVRVVPAASGVLFGRSMTAGDMYSVVGAVPVATAEGPGDGTRWQLARVGTPIGVAVSQSGALYYSDRSFDVVRVVAGA